jgi:hypothetical protein
MEITKGKDNKPHACEACVSGKQRGRESAQARGGVLDTSTTTRPTFDHNTSDGDENNDYLTPDENEDLEPLINPGNIRRTKQKAASPPPALRTFSRARKPPVRLEDELNEGMTAERAKKANKAKRPVQNLPSNATNSYIISYAVKVDTDPDCPRNRRQAMESGNREHWLKAEKEEMASHLENKTWILVDRKAGINVLTGKHQTRREPPISPPHTPHPRTSEARTCSYHCQIGYRPLAWFRTTS